MKVHPFTQRLSNGTNKYTRFFTYRCVCVCVCLHWILSLINGMKAKCMQHDATKHHSHCLCCKCTKNKCEKATNIQNQIYYNKLYCLDARRKWHCHARGESQTDILLSIYGYSLLEKCRRHPRNKNGQLTLRNGAYSYPLTCSQANSL